MSEKKNFWTEFAEKHPAGAKWIREGGLFIIVSNLVTVLKYLILQFLPKMLTNLPDTDFGWPGIDMTLFGETFKSPSNPLHWTPPLSCFSTSSTAAKGSRR